MNTKNILYLIFILFVFNSCEWLLGYKDLGNGYFFIEGSHYSNIIYNDNKKDGRLGNGYEIIPHEVIQFKHNKSNLIVVNIDIETKSRNYWIIEKDKALSLDECKASDDFTKALKSNVIGPLDSTKFHAKLNQKNINLKFK